MKIERVLILSLMSLQLGATWASIASAAPGPVLQQVSFEGRTRLDPESTRYFKVKVGRTDGTNPASPLLAVFNNGKGQQVARCRVTRFEKSRARTPKNLGLDCTKTWASFPGTSDTEVALTWEKTGVVLKFGNWLTGTQSIAIEVDRDSFSAPRLEERPTQLAQNGAF